MPYAKKWSGHARPHYLVLVQMQLLDNENYRCASLAI